MGRDSSVFTLYLALKTSFRAVLDSMAALSKPITCKQYQLLLPQKPNKSAAKTRYIDLIRLPR